MIKVAWDKERTNVETPTMRLVIRTGRTQAFKNWMTVMRLKDIRQAERFEELLNATGEYISSWPSKPTDAPNVPEILRVQTYGRDWCVVWGVVLTGARRRHQRLGEYRFILCLLDELEDVLDHVFQIEKVLRVS